MEEYCTCGFRRIDQAFFTADHVYCSNCDQAVGCDVTALDDTVKPQPAEMTGGVLLLCWHHYYGLADCSDSVSRELQLTG